MSQKIDLIHTPLKGKIQNNIICNRCGQDSGWTNQELARVPIGDKDMQAKCEKCKQPCILFKAKEKMIVKEEGEYLTPKENWKKYISKD